MEQKVIEIIEYENESYRVDFKKIEYTLGKHPKKYEILKDFMSFVNHLSDDEKYIIIGVKELSGTSNEIFNIELPTDEAKYRQFINEYIEPQINFEYKNFKYKGETICYFRFFGNTDRPYLVKKEHKNPIDNKADLKYGDGYIRIGTSTNKIGRKEMDDISKSKLKYSNRHNDIVIHPKISLTTNSELSNMNIKYLDLDIENTSNQSIDLNIEMKITKENSFDIVTETEFIKEMRAKLYREKQARSLLGIGHIDIAPINIPLNTYTQETEDYFKIERLPRNHKSAIIIPQNSTYNDVFLQSIILFSNSDNLIEAQVIIRSDEFSDGALKKLIKFKS